MESIKKLAIFLKLFNAYDAYILNTKTSIYTTDKISYISGAFTWCCTEQGNDFWFELDKKWKLFLENKTMLEISDKIKLFNIPYEISKDGLGYYLHNSSSGRNSEIFDKLGLNVNDYDVGLGGVFPYRKTIDELQELIIELAEKAIDKTGTDSKFMAIFRNDYEYSKEMEQPEKENHNQESTEKDCLITEPIITIKKHKKQTFVL